MIMAEQKKPKRSNLQAIANYSKDRLWNKNKNSLNIFLGETGGGKTYSCATFSGTVDETFWDDIDRVVFGPEEFIEIIQSCSQGDAIMYEEAGFSMSAREFMSKQNKMIGIVNQTFRHRNLCVSYTVPSMRFIDLQIRDMMHTIFEMKYINPEKKLAYGKTWRVNHNALYGSTKLDKYEFTTYGGGRHVVDMVAFPMPQEKWIQKYEVKKLEFTTMIMDEFKESLAGDASGPNKTDIQYIQSHSNVLLKLLPEIKKDYTWDELEKFAGVSGRTMRNWIKRHDEMEE